MGSLHLSAKSLFTTRTQLPWFSSETRRTTRTRTVHLKQRNKVFAASRSQEEDESPQLNSEDLMELKFARLLGEDPKLTLAKVLHPLLFHFSADTHTYPFHFHHLFLFVSTFSVACFDFFEINQVYGNMGLCFCPCQFDYIYHYYGCCFR